jgi:hypothetical protein
MNIRVNRSGNDHILLRFFSLFNISLTKPTSSNTMFFNIIS